MTIYELLELANKMYGVYIRHEVVFNNGSFSGVMIRIVNVVSGVKIKADKLILEDLVINDSSKESVNKAIYHPKASNLFFKALFSNCTFWLTISKFSITLLIKNSELLFANGVFFIKVCISS